MTTPSTRPGLRVANAHFVTPRLLVGARGLKVEDGSGGICTTSSTEPLDQLDDPVDAGVTHAGSVARH